ncbi:hypothetical protein [Paraburkholderia sp.]|uniref:hypothetical protein n=1 Tax=Paraburkholderia sp. TaxID=1926495 RepID=UPI003C7D4205
MALTKSNGLQNFHPRSQESTDIALLRSPPDDGLQERSVARIPRYLPLHGFAPKLIEPETLNEFADISSPLAPVTDWPSPNRRATPQALLAMVAAVRERQMLEVQYQSMTREEPCGDITMDKESSREHSSLLLNGRNTKGHITLVCPVSVGNRNKGRL